MKYFIFAFIFFFMFIPDKIVSQKYQKVYSKNGIHIYKKEKEDSRNFKLSFKVKKPVDEVMHKLIEPQNYSEWFSDIVDFITIDKKNGEILSYTKIEIVNVFTRDGVIKTEFQQTSNTEHKLIKQQLIKNHPEAQNEHPPFKKFESKWLLTKVSNNKTKVELYFEGGMEEDSDIMNTIIDKILTNRLYNLATEIKEP